MSAQQRGFSLLEVIVAVAILGLGLTTILSAQAGLFSTSTRGANMTRASNLARCKMSEVELKLARDGFPITDEKDEGHCCEDEEDDGFTCVWMVETVLLPNIDLLDGGVDAGELGGDGGLGGPSASGGLKLDAGLNTDSTGLGQLGLVGDGMSAMGLSSDSMSGMSDSVGSMDGMASMALSMVYPAVKPMFEASIRRVMVTVKWREGINERTFEIGQYLTNPQQGGMVPGMPGYDPEAGGNPPTGTATGTTTGGGPPNPPQSRGNPGSQESRSDG